MERKSPIEIQHLQFLSVTNLFPCPKARSEGQIILSPEEKGKLELEKRDKRHSFIRSVNLSFLQLTSIESSPDFKPRW